MTFGKLASTTARNASNVVASPSRDPSSRLRRCVLPQLSAVPQRLLILDPLQPRAVLASVRQSSSHFRPSSRLLGTRRHSLGYPRCSLRLCLSHASRLRAAEEEEEGDRAGETCQCIPVQRRIIPRACCNRAYPPQIPKSLFPVDKRVLCPFVETFTIPTPTLHTGMFHGHRCSCRRLLRRLSATTTLRMSTADRRTGVCLSFLAMR